MTIIMVFYVFKIFRLIIIILTISFFLGHFWFFISW
jgi:hypothetical protein